MIFLMEALLVLLLVLFSAFDSNADIYKQISDDGVIVFSNAGSGADSKIVVREKNATWKGDKHPDPGCSRETFRETVEEKARHYNVDPQLVSAVIRAESNWNPAAVSAKGALGLMQLMPSTAALLGVTNPFDPAENIEGGVRYIGNLIERFNGNLILALAAYNAGPGLVVKKGAVPSIPETVSYVNRVMQYYNSGRGLAFNADEIGREVKKEFVRMKKIILEDGTLLFTNTYNCVAKSY
ncbi:MAG: lytic transglycosylase domain-containing protein [Nitrospirae bacterium]|nr:lytic transglycosylase domain-containing protein [Nitrospirota bacterium]